MRIGLKRLLVASTMLLVWRQRSCVVRIMTVESTGFSGRVYHRHEQPVFTDTVMHICQKRWCSATKVLDDQQEGGSLFFCSAVCEIPCHCCPQIPYILRLVGVVVLTDHTSKNL